MISRRIKFTYPVQEVLSFNYGMLNALYRQRFLNEIEVSCEFEDMEKRNLAKFISNIFPTRNRDSSSLFPVAKKYFLKTDTPKQYLLKRLEISIKKIRKVIVSNKKLWYIRLESMCERRDVLE